MRRFLVPAALVLASTAFALLVGEAASRLLFKDETVMFPRYHTDYRYGPYALRGIRPNLRFRHTSVDGTWAFVTNSRGLRDEREFSYQKPAGLLRVLAIGDSHTQGYEVRQDATYAATLERYLAARGVRAEVLNAGVSGFSNAEALAYLENEGYKYQPDVVVLGFYANDYQDNVNAGLFGLEGGRLVERRKAHLPGVSIQNLIYSLPGVQWLGENSYLYSLAFNGAWRYAQSLMAARASAAPVEYAVALKAGPSPRELSLAAALVERMRRFCASRSMRLIVVDIPVPRGRYDWVPSVPDEGFGEAEVLTSASLFGTYEGAMELHLPRGHRHLSELGHAAVAAELGRRILGPR
jgi:GDSL-like Lipase/Acylhydrolase family